MKLVVTVIFTCIVIINLCSGCSREEKFENSKQVTVFKQAIPKKPENISESQIELKEPQKEVAVQMEAALKDENAVVVSKVAEKKDPGRKEEKGYYIVNKGECLKDIAGKPDILGDPLKWPVLFRLNMDELNKMGIDEDLPSRELSEGTKLKIYTQEEREHLSKTKEDNLWVVNVLSAKTNKRIIPNALKLIKYGYPAYISRVKVKGEDWMRLRVGFYDNKDEANKEGSIIMEQLKLTDIWITKVDMAELNEFGKYQ